MKNPIVLTIAKQVRHQGITGSQLASDDGNTLRIVKVRIDGKKIGARGGFVNVDIAYDEGTDLYNVSYHQIDNKTLEHWTNEYEGIYADQLADLLRDVSPNHES